MTKTILLIEDDESTTRLITIALERQGYRVLSASNGLEGLQKTKDEHPDVILLDLMLPGVDGFEVLNRLRNAQATADLPVIVVSAKNQASDRERAQQLGATAYFTKPYKVKELDQLLQQILSNPEPAQHRAPLQQILAVGPRPSQVSTVTVYTAATLAETGEAVTVVDLHPYAVEHSLLLDITPPSTPISLLSLEESTTLLEKGLAHVSGLRLINNLVGSGEFGQLTDRDLHTLSSALPKEERYLFLDVPLHPSDPLKALATKAALTLVVTENRPAALNATRSILDLLVGLEIPEHRLGFVFIGEPPKDEKLTDLDLPILATVPRYIDLGHPDLEALADKVQRRLGHKQ